MARILIVEDEVIINKRMVEGLTLAGHKCFCAFNGTEGLDMINKHPFDLVILDVMLPGMTGFEIIKHILLYL